MRKHSTLLFVICVLTVACSASAAAEILIATAAPISGRYAWMGEQYKRGAEIVGDGFGVTLVASPISGWQTFSMRMLSCQTTARSSRRGGGKSV